MRRTRGVSFPCTMLHPTGRSPSAAPSKPPLHRHLDIAALLIKHNTKVNATDRWGFTPLHEASTPLAHSPLTPHPQAAQKGRTQLCALLLAHGSDPCLRNHEGQSALDLATAEDVKCLLMDAQVEPPIYSADSSITAAVSQCGPSQKTCPEPECCESTPSPCAPCDQQQKQLLHHLMQQMNIAYNPPHTPLTSLPAPSQTEVPSSLALLLSQRNADNVNGDSDASVSDLSAQQSSSGEGHVSLAPPGPNNTATLPASVPTVPTQAKAPLITHYLPVSNLPAISVAAFLVSIGLEFLAETLSKEHITLDILAEMNHEDLKQIGVSAYGHRHKILKGIEKLLISSVQSGNSASGSPVASKVPSEGKCGPPLLPSASQLSSLPGSSLQVTTFMVQLSSDDREYKAVEDEMQLTIRQHKDGGQAGGVFSSYRILRIQKLINVKLWQRYLHRRSEICEENHGFANERILFHGSSFINAIVQKGFDERHAYIGGMFGAGIYFAENSSKSNQYVYGECHSPAPPA